MRAYAIDEFGKEGSVRDVPLPEPGPGEVRVRVAAASINPFDNSVLKGMLKDRLSHNFPLIPCSDLSGTVDAVGSGVEQLRPGDEVFGQKGTMAIGHGTLAEFTLASPGSVAKRPDYIDAEFGAALPLAGVAALQCIEPMQLKKGDAIVILGAAGGIGGFAVMMAKGAGAAVIGVASARNAEYVRDLGADKVIDYATANLVDAVRKLQPQGIKGVVHTSGDAETVMALAGLIVEGGFVASMRGGAKVDDLAARHITGVNVMTRTTTEALDRLAATVKAGELKRPAIKTFRLEDAAGAFAEIGTGHGRGKLVVIP